jgi:hypothetical protein
MRRDEPTSWAGAPHMFTCVILEGKLSKGLLYLAEREESLRKSRAQHTEILKQAASLGG